MPELFAATLVIKDEAKNVLGHVDVAGLVLMKDYRLWVAAESAGDVATTYRYLRQVIKKWDFTHPGPPDGMASDNPDFDKLSAEKGRALDPQNLDDYDALDVRWLRGINKAVGRWLRQEELNPN